MMKIVLRSLLLLTLFVAGMLLEIQTSTDLGLADPWFTIASKSGAGAWSGFATVVTGPVVDGRVTMTISDVQLIAGVPQNFIRVRLSAL